MMGGGPIEHVLFGIAGPEQAEWLEPLRAKFPDIEFSWHGGDSMIGEISKERMKGITILVTWKLLPADISSAPDLKWLQTLSAGSDHLKSHPLYTDSKIAITTASGIHGPQIAEWVIMTALVQNHSYNALHDAQKKHAWKPQATKVEDFNSVTDYVGQRVGILGYGSIGRQVARVGKAMGMEVLAFTAHPRESKQSKRDGGYIVPGTGDPDGEIPIEWYSGLDKKSLHNFLGQNLDVLVLTLPLTPDTTHLLSDAEFEVLSKRARPNHAPPLISNISRGAIIDTDALITALYETKIRGACLDVTDPEPLPEDHLLWDAPNVIITPHISGGSNGNAKRTVELFGENLERWRKGGKLFNRVDRKSGY